MKRLISLILFLTMVVILIGCAGTTGQRPSDQDSLTNEVGNATFVGDHSDQWSWCTVSTKSRP